MVVVFFVSCSPFPKYVYLEGFLVSCSMAAFGIGPRRFPPPQTFPNAPKHCQTLQNNPKHQKQSQTPSNTPKRRPPNEISQVKTVERKYSTKDLQTKVPKRRSPNESSQTKIPRRKPQVAVLKRSFQSELPKRKYSPQGSQSKVPKQMFPNENSRVLQLPIVQS